MLKCEKEQSVWVENLQTLLMGVCGIETAEASLNHSALYGLKWYNVGTVNPVSGLF